MERKMTMSPKHLLVALAILAATPSFSQEHPATTRLLQQHDEESDRMLALVVLLGAPLLPPAMPQDATPTDKKGAVKNGTTLASQQHQDDGQRIFEQNCARCHNAPEGFSPRIAGTIVRHMRVRASLSKQEEEELLRFFNP
jgi:hypothetical protein